MASTALVVRTSVIAYSREHAEYLCNLIAEGMGAKAAAKALGISSSTFFLWLRRHEEFRKMYIEAKQISLSIMAEDIVDISDNDAKDITIVRDEKGMPTGQIEINHENIQRSKLRVDTRKWLLSKLVPDKYGDRVINEHTGEGGGPVRVISRDMTAAEAAEAYSNFVRGGSSAPLAIPEDDDRD